MKAGRITDREKPSPCDPPASRPRSARRSDVAFRLCLRLGDAVSKLALGLGPHGGVSHPTPPQHPHNSILTL